MANQIEIFRVDFGDTINSIEKLKVELKETRKLFEAAKPNTEEFLKYSSEVKRLDGTIKNLNATTKDQVNGLGGVNQAAKFASGSYGELKQKIDAQKKALLELNVESEDFANAQKELITLQNQRIEIEKKIPSLFQERIKGAIDESNSLKQLKADLRAANAAALNGDGEAAKRAGELRDKLEDLKDTTTSLKGSGVERLNTSVGLLSQGFQDFDADKIKTGFKGIGAAMSAIPLILLIEGIKELIENFDVVLKFGKELTGSFNATEKAVISLTKSTEAETIVNKGLISQYDNQIALLTAQGGKEKEITELKKKKILVEIAEAENIVSLNAAKVAQVLINDTITDSIDRITISLLRKVGQDKAADALENVILANKKERAKEELKAIQDAQIGIASSKTALQVLDIEYNKKQIESSKKRAEEQKKIEDKAFEETKKGNEDSLEYIIDLDNKYLENKKNINKQVEDGNAESLEIIKEQNEIALRDDVIRAQTKVELVKLDGGNLLAAKIELLKVERDTLLENDELTNDQRLQIATEFRARERELKVQGAEQDLATANNLTNSLSQLSDSLYVYRRSNLQKGSEEDKRLAEQQFKVNKGFSYATAIISGAQAILSASASVPYLPTGLAAGIAASALTTAQLLKISSTKFQYFDGGFTSKGDPTQQAESIGNAQFHNDEYVVPSKVKNLPSAIPHITQLERMRQGYSKSNISGFYDGGFTQRSVSSTAMSNSNLQDIITSTIASMPTPIVKVTDINKVSKRNEVSINVSGL